MIIADDLTLGVEHLADFHGNLGFFEAGSQILDVADGGTDADDRLDIVVALQGIDDGSGQLFHIAGVVIGLDLLDQHGISLADIKDEVLLLVREQAADDVVGRDIVAGGHADQKHDTLHIGDKVQLSRFGVDIAGQDVIQHDVFDEVGLIKFFVVILFDALQANRQHGRELLSRFIGALDKCGIVVMLGIRELMVGIAVAHKSIASGLVGSGYALAHLADLPQL